MKHLGAEFFGTFWLVLGGCGAAVIAVELVAGGLAGAQQGAGVGLAAMAGTERQDRLRLQVFAVQFPDADKGGVMQLELAVVADDPVERRALALEDHLGAALLEFRILAVVVCGTRGCRG